MKNIITQILATFNIKVAVTEVSNGLVLGNLVMMEIMDNHISGKQEFRIGVLTKESIIEASYQIADDQKATRCTNPEAAVNFAIMMLIGKFVHDQVEYEFQRDKTNAKTQGTPTFKRYKPVATNSIH